MLLLKPSLPHPAGVALGLWKPGVALPSLKRTGHCCYWFPFYWPSQCLALKFAHILANNCSEQTVCLTLDTLWLLFSVLCLWYLAAMPRFTWPQGYGGGADWSCQGCAGYVGVGCMIRPLNMAVLRFSVYFLPDQCLLDLNPKHMTDLPTYLPQAPAGDMCGLSSSVVSDFLRPHGLQPTRLFCPWNSPV